MGADLKDKQQEAIDTARAQAGLAPEGANTDSPTSTGNSPNAGEGNIITNNMYAILSGAGLIALATVFKLGWPVAVIGGLAAALGSNVLFDNKENSAFSTVLPDTAKVMHKFIGRTREGLEETVSAGTSEINDLSVRAMNAGTDFAGMTSEVERQYQASIKESLKSAYDKFNEDGKISEAEQKAYAELENESKKYIGLTGYLTSDYKNLQSHAADTSALSKALEGAPKEVTNIAYDTIGSFEKNKFDAVAAMPPATPGAPKTEGQKR